MDIGTKHIRNRLYKYDINVRVSSTEIYNYPKAKTKYTKYDQQIRTFFFFFVGIDITPLKVTPIV